MLCNCRSCFIFIFRLSDLITTLTFVPMDIISLVFRDEPELCLFDCEFRTSTREWVPILIEIDLTKSRI